MVLWESGWLRAITRQVVMAGSNSEKVATLAHTFGRWCSGSAAVSRSCSFVQGLVGGRMILWVEKLLRYEAQFVTVHVGFFMDTEVNVEAVPDISTTRRKRRRPLTPKGRVDICRRQLSLWQKAQHNSHTRPQPAVPSEFLAVFANQVAAAHRSEFPVLSVYSQSGRRNCLVCVCSLVGAAQHVCSAVNSLSLSLRPFPFAGASLFHTRTTSLYFVAPTFFFLLLSLRSVSPLCYGHCVQTSIVGSGLVWKC